MYSWWSCNKISRVNIRPRPPGKRLWVKELRNLVVGFSKAPWEWDHITNIYYSGSQKNYKVEVQTESSMFDCAISAKIQVPFILLAWQPQFLDSINQIKKQ